MLVESHGMKIFQLGKIIAQIEFVCNLIDVVSESPKQHIDITKLLKYMDVVVPTESGLYFFIEFENNARTLYLLLDNLFYKGEKSILKKIHAAKEYSSGVLDIQATERINILYDDLLENSVHISETNLHILSSDLVKVKDMCRWINAVLSRDWNWHEKFVRIG